MEQLHSNPFKNSGIALLIIGLIDIGVMAYCISNQISYSSSFNIFAVIAGVFLIKGGIKTARTVRWFSAFLIVSFAGLLFILPLTTPLGLLITQLKLNTLSFIGSFILGIIFIAVLIWLHLQLSTPEALRLLGQAGYDIGKPKSAYIAGASMMLLGACLFYWLLTSESAQKAKALAQAQLGQNYQYHVTSISVSNDHGNATVTAYTSSEIKNVQVQW